MKQKHVFSSLFILSITSCVFAPDWGEIDGEGACKSAAEYFAIANKEFEKSNWKKAESEYFSCLTDPAVLLCTQEEARKAHENWERCKKELKEAEKRN